VNSERCGRRSSSKSQHASARFEFGTFVPVARSRLRLTKLSVSNFAIGFQIEIDLRRALAIDNKADLAIARCSNQWLHSAMTWDGTARLSCLNG